VSNDFLLRVQRDVKRPVDAARKRACPRCDGVKLKRHFFSARKSVEVDQCPSCNGYWLDAGELEKVRAEIAAKTTQAAVQVTTISMETIRYVYQMRVEQRAP
jgi:Zn-finger nucleic acid-binding protein